MFHKKKTPHPTVPYDPATQIPILKCSICNGEQIAGFKDIKTGKFTEVTLIKDNTDLDLFLEMYHLASITKEY